MHEADGGVFFSLDPASVPVAGGGSLKFHFFEGGSKKGPVSARSTRFTEKTYPLGRDVLFKGDLE